jgi:poly-gamma-glutamate synthesis protein (capsule biosynthesis protein)
VGDLTFSRSGARSFGDPDTLLTEVAPLLQTADLSYGNLETPLSDRGSPADKSFTFRGPLSAAPALARAGFDVMSVANNHSLDYGRKAFDDTLRALDKAGVNPVGGGKNHQEAWAPLIVERKGALIAFLAFSEITPTDFAATSSKSGCAYTQDFAAVKKAVVQAAKEADYVVVGMHWGIEGDYEPTSRQVKEAHALIKAGAAAVLGSHPHVLQGIEFYQDGLIAYSMGNFLFSPGSDKGRDSAILSFTLTDDGPRMVSARAAYLARYAPTLPSGSNARRILNILKKGSVQRGTSVELEESSARFTQ